MARRSVPVIDAQGLRHHAPADAVLAGRVTVLCGRTVVLGALVTPPTGQCPDCASALTNAPGTAPAPDRRVSGPPGPGRAWARWPRLRGGRRG